MEKINKSKWQVRLAALIIFVLGFAAGSLAFNAYQRLHGGGRAGRQDRFERMLDHLQLSPEQRTQVQQIISDTRSKLQALRQESEPQVNEIRQEADKRLQEVMTPEQWEKFQKIRGEMRERRRGGGARPIWRLGGSQLTIHRFNIQLSQVP